MHAWELAGLTDDYWVEHALDMRIRIAAAPYMYGWGYDLTNPAVLYDLPVRMGAGKMVRRSKYTNCSTLTLSLLTEVYPNAPWALKEYGDLQVYADRLPEQPGSPIEAAERMGIAKKVNVLTPSRWHLIQGWRRFDPPNPNPGRRYSGHAFLVLADADGDGILMLEATSREGIGPRYRRTTMRDLMSEYPKGLWMAVLSQG